jgi:hypothetical protein
MGKVCLAAFTRMESCGSRVLSHTRGLHQTKVKVASRHQLSDLKTSMGLSIPDCELGLSVVLQSVLKQKQQPQQY